MGIFDKIKDFFTVKSKNEKEDMQYKEAQMMEQLRKLSGQYAAAAASQPKPSASLNLTQLNANAVSDDDIKKAAAASTDKDYRKKAENLLSQNEYAADALNARKENYAAENQSGKAELNSLISELKDAAEKDALKRGLARSSIATGRLDKLDGLGVEGIIQLNAKLSERLDGVDKELARLNTELKKALDNLELDKAYDLDATISNLKNERDNAVNDIIKYNNTLIEKENNYGMSYDKYLQDIFKARKENEARYGYSGDKEDNYRERYDAALAFYKSIEPKYARQLIENNPELKGYLGSYYSKLLAAV